MSSTPIRRAQLVAPFGVGAIVTSTDGTAMVSGGLDHWFRRSDGTYEDVDIVEFRVDEWRLQEALGVSHFRLPPDHRGWRAAGGATPKNLRLTVPFLRFPRWHFCPHCRALEELGFAISGRQRCPRCVQRLAAGGGAASGGKKPRASFLAQVPFVAICEGGHLQDFPWREWVHKDRHTTCRKALRLVATGGASLAAQRVECECNVKPRNLAQITDATKDAEGNPDTFLSRGLDPNGRYLCRGARPWLGDDAGEGCGLPIRGSLRAAANVYFAQTESAIYLPGGTAGIAEKLLEILTNPPLSTSINLIRKFGQPLSAALLAEDDNAHLLDPFPPTEIDSALRALTEDTGSADDDGSDEVDAEAIRRPEYRVIREGIQAADLKIRPQEVAAYEPGLTPFVSRINLIDQLRETRALYGFSRVAPEANKTRTQRRAMLWRKEPDHSKSWLPAYIVNGEGIYLELDEDRLSAWEQRDDVHQRLDVLIRQYNLAKARRGLQERSLVPRFVLLHTLAHLVINQLTFDCGYSSASLRERLYCETGDAPMAGLLIYTAAGDSEGTMGGLVRMGRAGNFEPSFGEALDRARWCSSDPVCMELGKKGQGPDSCNLAACHSCALVPETACEHFNRFLDRAMVIGTMARPEVGFFTGLWHGAAG